MILSRGFTVGEGCPNMAMLLRSPEDVVLVGPEGKWSWFFPPLRMHLGAEDTPFWVSLEVLSETLRLAVEESLGLSGGSALQPTRRREGKMWLEFRSLPHLVEVCGLLFKERDREARRELEEPSPGGRGEAWLDCGNRRGQAGLVEAWDTLMPSVLEHGYYWLLSDCRYSEQRQRLVGTRERWLCVASDEGSFEGIGCSVLEAWSDGSRWKVDRAGLSLERVRGRLCSDLEGSAVDEGSLPPTRVMVDGKSGRRWLRTVVDD